MTRMGINFDTIRRHIRACDYLAVAQLFLRDNFLLDRSLSAEDIKPRLLGHWGTCHGINVAYANLKAFFKDDENFSFILGPGHGFPALQANLFIDGELEKVDPKATRDLTGISYICQSFSWPGGYPSHASPVTPGVVCEGGELGYALGIGYGVALGHPEKTVAVLIGDGELETATALDSLNLIKLLGGEGNGRVLPVLHLNGYKISAPTIYGRKSERELNELIRGFGYTPVLINGDRPEVFQNALDQDIKNPFYILKTKKGDTGPETVNGKKVAGNYLAHQIPLPKAKSDSNELRILENWLKSYRFNELFNAEEGFKL